jgi:hypothetical protein
MRYFSFWGTQTGRLNTQKPHPYMDIRDVRPKGTPMADFLKAYPNVKRFHNEIRTLLPYTHDEVAFNTVLAIDYRELENRMLENMRRYYQHNFRFDFKSLNYELPKTWQPTKPPNIHVMAKPIEITHLETFRVEMTIPQPAHTELLAITIGKLQDLLTPKCSCEMKILMRSGCRCGGA